jgi:hypothetical protein
VNEAAEDTVFHGSAFPMPGTYRCTICSDPLDGAVCKTCGADVVKVEETLQEAPPVVVPSFWQALWHSAAILPPTGESVWEHLSRDFRDTLLWEYRTRLIRARTVTSAVLIPVFWVLSAVCFWVGVAVAHAAGFGGGKVQDWLCGAVGQLLLLPLWMSACAVVEGWLLRCRGEVAARAVLDRFPFLGSAVIRRTTLPWYLNPKVGLPVVAMSELVVEWALL